MVGIGLLTITMVGIVSMTPRASVALAFEEKVVCSGGNGLGYQEGVQLFD